ncbi:unnamed protein product [Bursaphelenchus xylophilus]|uniref:(pine wood nematode) hypothetical protein n=1 Tax=Bursaphelenchus xylophilus TaxID=6326 RepID=A0A1I7SRW8_BURXY|nr:unnamed protein product [Bursaphelenchus xylophilus]CAG9101768.1 unnamed protein product [Bursaphelenchus xylophilus]
MINLVLSSSTRQLELAPPTPTEPASQLSLKGKSPHRFMEELEDEAGFRLIQATWKQEAGEPRLAVQVYATRLHRWLNTHAKLNLPANYECILARALAPLARENGLIQLDDYTEYQLFHYAKWDSQRITISNSVIPSFPLNAEGRYRPPSTGSSENIS